MCNLWGVFTCNVSASTPTLLPNHVSVVLMNSSRAMKAIRLTTILAIRAMEVDAPSEAASMMLWAVLKVQH